MKNPMLALVFLVTSAPAEAADTSNLSKVLLDLERSDETVVVAEVELYSDDGRMVYEVEYYRNGEAYEMAVDASTSTILSDERESGLLWLGLGDDDIERIAGLNVSLAQAVYLFEGLGVIDEVRVADALTDSQGYYVRFEDDSEMFVSGTSGERLQ